MMHSITNDRAKTDNGTKYTGIRILAVLFWIAIWQFASMYLKQEILLASPVSVIMRYQVTVHTPLSREVFWHEYAKIPRHTSQNSIAAGNLE